MKNLGFVRACWLISGALRRRLRCSFKLGCVKNNASFSDLVLFQLKRTNLQKFKKS